MLSDYVHSASQRFKKENAQAQSEPFFNDCPLIKALSILTLLSLTLLVLSYYFFGYHAYFMPINALAHFAPSWLLQMFTVMGDTTVALMVIFILYKGDQRLIWLTISTAIISGILSQVGKESFQAYRPAGVLSTDSFYLTGHVLKQGSFPSGHATTVFAGVSLLMFHYKHIMARCLLFACGITFALSRVWVGAHWPIDVFAGAFIGFLSVFLAYFLCLRIPQGLSLKAQTVFFALFVINSLLALLHDTGYPQARSLVILLSTCSLVHLFWHYRPSKVTVSQ